ncbi:hypothetical protein BSKO_03874 [Bryopsis sp. KO-2023]|nr:hypothetical protein BSKO_03874 [Bryopsis sp. KO-2023]
MIDAASLQGMEQFYQEVAVLGRIRHPHIVQLLGVCRDRGCLVYEMMDNGTLEDHLASKRIKSRPLKWVERLRIATDVSSALLFLHKARPHPILHRDIKPANILLDHSLSAKLGDVGLSKLVPELSTQSTVRTTAPIGTYAYMDPAYLTEGIVGSFTDVYALGITFLQLLIWMDEPVGIRKVVLDALEKDTLGETIDETIKGQSLSV